MKKTFQINQATFKQTLSGYKKLIDDDIEAYSKHIKKTTLQQYGKNARLEVDAFLEILGRGGKRIRGALTMLGYEMSGGTDKDMILQVARAIEMIHAYILIIDDIQDNSLVRRGGKTAHVSLADYHREHEMSGDSEHFGLSVALNSALSGAHAAQMILANLNAPEDLRLKVVSILNRTMLVTAHGQTNDIISEVVSGVSREDIEQVLEWKTAYYTFLNPLHVGMVLAGADCHATDAITPYAINIGKAFQITDDIIGTFGSRLETGKNPMDDVKSGQKTILVQFALESSNQVDKNFMIQTLGNQGITQAEFSRFKEILVESGALNYSRQQAKKLTKEAIDSLNKEKGRWSTQGVQFLKGMASYILTRTD